MNKIGKTGDQIVDNTKEAVEIINTSIGDID